jgi:hypothetical protein
MMTDKTVNQGEGDVRAARRYNRAVSDFARSPRGRERINLAGSVTADEAATFEQTERAGGWRATDDDPGVSRHHNRKTRT